MGYYHIGQLDSCGDNALVLLFLQNDAFFADTFALLPTLQPIHFSDTPYARNALIQLLPQRILSLASPGTFFLVFEIVPFNRYFWLLYALLDWLLSYNGVYEVTRLAKLGSKDLWIRGHIEWDFGLILWCLFQDSMFFVFLLENRLLDLSSRRIRAQLRRAEIALHFLYISGHIDCIYPIFCHFLHVLEGHWLRFSLCAHLFVSLQISIDGVSLEAGTVNISGNFFDSSGLSVVL